MMLSQCLKGNWQGWSRWKVYSPIIKRKKTTILSTTYWSYQWVMRPISLSKKPSYQTFTHAIICNRFHVWSPATRPCLLIPNNPLWFFLSNLGSRKVKEKNHKCVHYWLQEHVEQRCTNCQQLKQSHCQKNTRKQVCQKRHSQRLFLRLCCLHVH